MTRVITIAGTSRGSVSDLETIRVGGQAKQGDSSLSEMVLWDDTNALFGASESFIRKQWSVTEDASGGAVYLARGRIASFETHRGEDDSVQGVKVQYTFALEDQNLELRGHDVDAWVRPAEYGYQRVQALGVDYLNGSPRASTNLDTTTYVPSTNGFLMEAKTYNNADAIDVISECAEAEDKKFFVTVDHELFYDLETSTAYAASTEISDGVAGATAPNGTTYMAPIWDMGSALTWEGQDYASRIRMEYNQDSSVLVTDATSEAAHDLWVAHTADTESTTSTMATAFATADLNFRKTGERTYALSLKIAAAHAYRIKVGQVIWIQAQAAVDTTARVRRRIAELTWEPIGPGWYLAHLNLDRPVRRRLRGSTRGATSTGPKPAPECLPDTIVAPTTEFHWLFTTDELDMESSTIDIGLERTVPGGFGSNYGDSIGMDADGPYGHNDAGHFQSEAIPVIAGTVYSLTADIGWHFNPASRNVDVRWYDISDVIISTDRLISGSGRSTGVRYNGLNGTATAPVGADHCKIYWTNFAGLYADNIYWGTPGSVVAGASDPFCMTEPGESPYYARSDDPRFDAADQHDTSRLTQTLTNASGGDLVAGAVVIATSDSEFDTTATAGLTTARVGILLEDTVDGAEGRIAWETEGGITPTLTGAAADGDFIYTSTTPGEADVSATRTAGAIGRVVTVGGAGDPLYVEWWGVPDGTTSGGSFLTTSFGGQDDISTVLASGSSETLDLADGNWHDLTLTADCTISLTGATGGVGCSMLVLLRQDGTGGRTVTWPGSVSWPGGTAPSLADSPGDVTLVSLLTLDGGTNWLGAFPGTGGGSSGSHREVLMTTGISDPPDPLLSSDGTDWLYGVVT